MDEKELKLKVVVESEEATKNVKKTKDATKEATKEVERYGSEAKIAGEEASTGFKKSASSATMLVATLKNVVSGLKNIGNSLGTLVTKQSEYIEDLNFLDNAYGKANNSGKELLDTLNDMVGYDPSTLVKSVAVFRQMGNAMSIPTKQANMLSENLTKMAIDVKSITGQNLQTVASKFQSAMAGNIRAVRNYGVDITQAALQQTAYNLGIETSVKNMSRAEKSILIYLTMQKQLSTANGDLSRTVNSVANQWEIFQNQISQLGRLIGGFFIPMLKAILPVLNGIIMALNTIISMVMSFFGIDAESLSQEFGSNISSGFDNIEESANNAGKAAKNAQKSLRGFDKLNNITTPTKSSGSSGASGGIDPKNWKKLMEGFGEYNLHLEEMNNWATKIKDKIMGWLGFTKQVDATTKKVSYKFGGIHTLLKRIFILFEKNPLSELRKAIEAVISPWTFFIAKMKEALIMNDKVWNAVREELKKTKKVLEPLYDLIVKKVIPDIKKGLDTLYKNVIKPFSDFLDQVFADIWLDVIIPAWDEINEEILPPLIEGLKTLWNEVLVPLGNFLLTYIKPAIDGIIGVLKILWDNILKPFMSFLLETVITRIKDWAERLQIVAKAGSIIKDTLKTLWDNVMKPFWEWLKPKYEWFKDNILDKLLTPIKNALKNIKDTFIELKNAVKNFTVGSALTKFLEAMGVVKTKGGAGGGKQFATGGLYEGGQWKPMHTYANGGFPSRGEIFMARETRGPELVGKIGSSTAIMNNDQILDQMTIAVARGMQAGGNKETNVNIIAKGDTKGLLDFIEFEQASRSRQFGL